MAGNGKDIPSFDDLNAWDKEKKARAVLNTDGLSKATEKQKNLITNMVANPEAPFKQNAIDAGYSPNNNFDKVKKEIQGRWGEVLAEAGILEMDVAQCLAEGIRAERVVFKPKVVEENGKTRTVYEAINFPDHRIRATYVKLILTMSGALNRKIEIDGRMQHTHRFSRVLDKIPTDILEEEIERMEAEGIDADFEILEESA